MPKSRYLNNDELQFYIQSARDELGNLSQDAEEREAHEAVLSMALEIIAARRLYKQLKKQLIHDRAVDLKKAIIDYEEGFASS